ncbi:hypothetical protein, partial [Enterobacter hormaechei]
YNQKTQTVIGDIFWGVVFFLYYKDLKFWGLAVLLPALKIRGFGRRVRGKPPPGKTLTQSDRTLSSQA